MPLLFVRKAYQPVAPVTVGSVYDHWNAPVAASTARSLLSSAPNRTVPPTTAGAERALTVVANDQTGAPFETERARIFPSSHPK